MCITAECPDPTEPGVWWREDHCWKEYSPEHIKLIKQAMAAQETTVSLGVIKSTDHPQGHPYVINLQTMKQSNVHSGYQRSIKIVPDDKESWIPLFGGLVSKVVPACMKETDKHGTSSSSSSGVPKAYYKTKEGAMQPYSDVISRKIILGAAAAVRSVSFMTGNREHVVVDLGKMKETKHTRGKRAPEVKIELPWKPGALDNAKMDDKKTLQKKLIAALLDELINLHLMDKAMLEKFKLLVTANPHMQMEGNTPMQKFVDALSKAAASDNKIIGEILDTLKENDTERLQSMNIVFHGTPSCNIERILKFGLDPEKSKSSLFYVALKPEISMPYTRPDAKPDRKVVVLLELKAPSVQEAWKDVHTIPIQQPELLLPIATAVSKLL